LLDRCELWPELPTPELRARYDAAPEESVAYLRFGDGGLTFRMPDVPRESEGELAAVPVLWSDALGRGVEDGSFVDEVLLCYATDGPEGWRCHEVVIAGIEVDGSERLIRGADDARAWLRQRPAW
jgi:hypothetical protein